MARFRPSALFTPLSALVDVSFCPIHAVSRGQHWALAFLPNVGKRATERTKRAGKDVTFTFSVALSPPSALAVRLSPSPFL